jgi:predicted phosphodiesterase
MRTTRGDTIFQTLISAVVGFALLGPAIAVIAAEPSSPAPKLRVGLVADMHYADKDDAEGRFYRETPAKFDEAARRFSDEKVDFIVELGDIIDTAASNDAEKDFLKRIAKDFAAAAGEHYYVLGNHCVEMLTKPEFLEITGQKKAVFSFDKAGWHFVVLDACFRSDGTAYERKNFQWQDSNLPAEQIDWLRSDLKQATGKVIVFIHQRLDITGNEAVKNAPDIRRALEESGKVKAVFMGHSHKNDERTIGGIHYCTLNAMVLGSGAENNAYAVLDILPDDVVRVTGFRKQKSYEWK